MPSIRPQKTRVIFRCGETTFSIIYIYIYIIIWLEKRKFVKFSSAVTIALFIISRSICLSRHPKVLKRLTAVKTKSCWHDRQPSMHLHVGD